MRWLNNWAAVAGATALSAAGCLTSQDNPGGGGRIEDPPITIGRGGGSSGNSQGGTAGDETGGTGQRGGRSGASGTGNGTGGSDSGCTDDGDCRFRVDDRSICSEPTGECVDCLTADDCDVLEECVDNECRVIPTCTSTEDCSPGLVCDTSADRCVECNVVGDCAADEICANNTCRTRCTADGHCALLGMRCDRGRGYCVSCLGNDDCAESRNCQNGTCVRDVCVGGSSSCDYTSYIYGVVESCSAAGNVENTPTSCTASTSCEEGADGASCVTWRCQPGTTGCATTGAERIFTCSDNGLEEEDVEECAAGEFCVTSPSLACITAVCAPNERFCTGNTVYLCDGTGQTSSPVQTCTAQQFCDESTGTATCVALRCTPNQPACDGTVFTTCNTTGTGYTGARTDCAMMGQFCSVSGCMAGAIDTIPTAVMPVTIGSALTNYTFIDFYSVTSSRTLTRIEVYMNSTSTTTTFNWVVFESATQTGTYTRLSLTTTTSTTGTMSYQGSGDLAVPLVAGRFYAIGVTWSSPGIDIGYQMGTFPQTVSFGSFISSGFVSGGTPPASVPYSTPATYLVPQRLTTAP